MRALLKRSAELLLGRGPLAALGRRRHAHDVLVLAWHNVVPDDLPPAGDRSLHLPLARFRAQLDRLVACTEVVPLAQAGLPSRGRPRSVITFDDAYAGAVRLALPELRRRGLPATVFVAPGRLGGQAFWWDALAGPTGLDEAYRLQALDALAGIEERVLSGGQAHGLTRHEVPAWLVTAGAAELGEAVAAADGRLTLGGHSWSHPALPGLSDDAVLDEELSRPLAWLREHHAGAMVPWMAYPYGLTDRRTSRAAERAGWEGALLVEGGYARGSEAMGFEVPRFNVPAGLSAGGLSLRIAGWRPA